MLRTINGVVAAIVVLVVLVTFLAHINLSRGFVALVLAICLVTAVIVRMVLDRPASKRN